MFRPEKKFLSRAAPPPPPSKGKNFWHQIWLDTCSDREKNFCQGPPCPPPVKGKIFDTRFGLIHVQTGKKFFVKGCPAPPPPVKGKIFDTRFGLIHVQTRKKIFVKGPPPFPPSPLPPRNSKKLVWLRGGRYASCVHAGGLSCLALFLEEQCSLQWRIQDFLEKGASTIKGGANQLFCLIFPKTAWKWKQFGPRGSHWHPLDPPMHWIFKFEWPVGHSRCITGNIQTERMACCLCRKGQNSVLQLFNSYVYISVDNDTIKISNEI